MTDTTLSPMSFLYFMTLHATESVQFPLAQTLPNASRWALRNNVCRTALYSSDSTYLHAPDGHLFEGDETVVLLESDTDTCGGELPHKLHLSNVVQGWLLANQKSDPKWRMAVPPSSCRVLVQSKPFHLAHFETNAKQLSLYGLHNDTCELLCISDVSNLDEVLAHQMPGRYWHQRLVSISLGDLSINTQRVFSRWQRWVTQGLSLSQRYAALEASLIARSIP